jgi:hypothetical protein
MADSVGAQGRGARVPELVIHSSMSGRRSDGARRATRYGVAVIADDNPLRALIPVNVDLRLDPAKQEAVASLWATAVAWSEYAADQNGAEVRADAGSDPQAAELRRAFSAPLSESEAAELRRASEEAAEELRSIVGSMGGHDIVDLAMRLHRQEWALIHNEDLSVEFIASKRQELRCRAIASLRA